MNSQKISSIALSVSASPSFNDVWAAVEFPSPEAAFERIAKQCELETQSFIRKKYSKKPLEAAREIYNECESKSIRIVDYWDDDYPFLLKEIKNPPLVLYVKGTLDNEKKIAIVGTRNADKRSREIAYRLSRDLSGYGFIIVSGMAIGIDREAHLGALSNGRATIGVLANGIDVTYPAANLDLHDTINASAHSSLVSEYPPGIIAGKWTFVRRNRIISGLSVATVVVKAGEKSGALITARYAMDQNRDVFVCPGYAFDPEYYGCHKLIKDGAALLSATEDIINEIPRFFNMNGCDINPKPAAGEALHDDPTSPTFDFSMHNYPPDSIESEILSRLSLDGSDIDSLIRALNKTPGLVNEVLIRLELDGSIRRNGNIIMREYHKNCN